MMKNLKELFEGFMHGLAELSGSEISVEPTEKMDGRSTHSHKPEIKGINENGLESMTCDDKLGAPSEELIIAENGQEHVTSGESTIARFAAMEIEKKKWEAEISSRDKMINELKRGVAHNFEIAQRHLRYAKKAFDMHNNLSARLERRERTIDELKLMLAAMEIERDAANGKVDELINKQQMEGFQGIEPARWTPREESQIRAELENLKETLKKVARKFAVATMPDYTKLSSADAAEYFLILKNVLRDKSGEDTLGGMNSSKVAGVLLNALLANAVYVRLFGDAFAFTHDIDSHSSILNEMYQYSIQANAETAHAWRAQTLRLMFPQPSHTSSVEEVQVHSYTKTKIDSVAKHHSAIVMGSPVMAFIKPEMINEARKEVEKIFLQAAHLSYHLWTRKTYIQCHTLVNFSEVFYHADDPRLTLHPLAPFDGEDENKYNGRLINLVVHPLVEIYGTDDGDHYESSRVLMPAEVWFPAESSTFNDTDLINLVA